jgi:hypothetical protein
MTHCRRGHERTPENLVEVSKGKKTCRLCRKMMVKKYRKDRPEKFNQISHRDNLRNKFGMTVEQYNEILDKQEGKCAICGSTPDNLGKRLAVDHDHVSGKKRGLLCTTCNVVLGLFKDNVARFVSAVEYLQNTE